MASLEDRESSRRKFQALCHQFSDLFRGEGLYFLKFLLWDYLGQNVHKYKNSIDLLNLLWEYRHISERDVEILEEVAQVTELPSAKMIIEEYKASIQCEVSNKGQRLSPYRRTLYNAVRKINDDSHVTIKFFYNILDYKFSSIWEIVSFLEDNHYLVNDKRSVEDFGRLLNPKATHILFESINLVLDRDTSYEYYDVEHYRRFVIEFSKCYKGERIKWLRMLLMDHIPQSKLSLYDEGLLLVFNELHIYGIISSTKIKLLEEIAQITQFKDAIGSVRDYYKIRKESRPVKSDDAISLYRRTLFKAMLQIDDSKQDHIMSTYSLKETWLKDIWDIVLCLEINEYLTDLNRFASLLNPRPKQILLSYLEEVHLKETSPSVSQKQESLYKDELRCAIEEKDWTKALKICSETSTAELYHMVNIVYENGWTPLLYAVWKFEAEEDLALKLISHMTPKYLDYIKPMNHGYSILHVLVHRSYKEALLHVLEKTSKDINTRDTFGRTPLHLCLFALDSYDGHRTVAEYLTAYGASCSIKDEDGNSPLDLYVENKCNMYEDTTRSSKKSELRKRLKELSMPSEIIERGRNFIKAYLDGIKHGKSITVNHSRLIFFGKEGSGKTSCVKAMVGEEFNENEPTTIGIDKIKVFQTKDRWNSEPCMGDIEFTKLIRNISIATNAANYLLTENTGDPLPSSTELFLEESKMIEEPKPVLYQEVAEKAVVATRTSTTRSPTTKEIISEEPQDTSYQHGYDMQQKIIDSLTDKQFDTTSIWDCGGQLTYYMTHRFCITDGSIYNVVFSLADNLDELATPRDLCEGRFDMTNLQMNAFWVRSIYEHSQLQNSGQRKDINGVKQPVIFLVGTHKDKLEGSEEEKMKQIKDTFDTILAEFDKKPYEKNVVRTHYAVDNSNPMDEGIKLLKKDTSSFMKKMAREMPESWLNFQEKVQKSENRLCVSIEEVTKMATECGISKEHVTDVLLYLSDIGIVFYGPKLNMVITNFHVLVKLCTDLIAFDISKVPPVMNSLGKKLINEGILAESLLHYLWKEIKDKSEFQKFIDVLKVFGILFEKNTAPGTDREFLVPCQIKTKTECLKVAEDDENMVSFYVLPKDFLPDPVFHILVVEFANRHDVKSYDPKLFCNNAVLGFSHDHQVRIGRVDINRKHSLKLEVRRLQKVDHGKKSPKRKPDAGIVEDIVSIVKTKLEEVLPSQSKEIGYSLEILCPLYENCKTLHFQDLDYCLKNDITCDKGSEPLSYPKTNLRRLFVATDQMTDAMVVDEMTETMVVDENPVSVDQKMKDERLADLFHEFGKSYEGHNFRWLKQLLFGVSSINILSDENMKAQGVFNDLNEKGVITYTDVNILEEIAKETEQKKARECVNEYKERFQCYGDGCAKLSGFRKALFKAMKATDHDDFNKLIHFYVVREQGFTNIWDLVFYLEKKKRLDDNQVSIERFASKLNATARSILLGTCD